MNADERKTAKCAVPSPKKIEEREANEAVDRRRDCSDKRSGWEAGKWLERSSITDDDNCSKIEAVGNNVTLKVFDRQPSNDIIVDEEDEDDESDGDGRQPS